MKFLLSFSLLTIASAAVPSLTPENFDELTAGKSVFIKYFAPWCGHCKSMAPDWEKLADEINGKGVALIAEVDCTIEGNEPICGAVQGYPTLKYGDPNSLEDYQGGREYGELEAFANESLGPVCSPNALDNCSDEEKAEIAKFDKLSVEELEKAVAEVEEGLAKAEKNFEDEVDQLQNKYDEMMKAVETKTESLKKESGYKTMKSVLSIKAPLAPAGDEADAAPESDEL